MIFLDTETCGLHGIIVIIQYAEDDQPVTIYDVWKEPVEKTLSLIEWFADNEVCIFNATFDWFHINKLYNIFRNIVDKSSPPDIMEVHRLEKSSRDGVCVKPKACLDLMLFARKGPFQVLMERDDLRIRRVPTVLAQPLADELEKRIHFDDIFFARRKKLGKQWQVYPIKDTPDFKNVVLVFKPSSALKALAKHALKIDTISYDDIQPDRKYLPNEVGWAPFAKVFEDHEIIVKGKRLKYSKTWPFVIKHYIKHWFEHKQARKYAENDITLLRELHKFFGKPPAGDDDSELACMVGAIRWRGFTVDLARLKRLRDEAQKLSDSAPKAPNAVMDYIRPKLSDAEIISLDIENFISTKKMVLEKITTLLVDCECRAKPLDSNTRSIGTFHSDLYHNQVNEKGLNESRTHSNINVMDSDVTDNAHTDTMVGVVDERGINGTDSSNIRTNIGCEKCKGIGKVKHPAANRAQKVLDARKTKKQIELYDKIIRAERLHADLNIVGTLSSRMSGASQLNVQAINKSKKIRKCFTLIHPGEVLNGGDFESFEVVIAISVYGDPDLAKEVTTFRVCSKCKGLGQIYLCGKCKGKGKIRDDEDNVIQCVKCGGNGELPQLNDCYECKGQGKALTKIHALMGTLFYPGKTYDEIAESSGTDVDLYTRSKSGFFALMYGGVAYTLSTRLGVEISDAEHAEKNVARRFPILARKRFETVNRFRAMTQKIPGGRVDWKEPDDYIQEHVLGHRRYFTLENRIRRALFDLAQKPPAAWRKYQGKIVRRDREQSFSGAVQSSLFAAAFQIQGRVERAAQNHEIQAAGAKITKHVQRNIWDMQPHGIHPFRVMPLNVHDELEVATDPQYTNELNNVVKISVDSFKDKVPLLSIDWKNDLRSWADK